MFIRVTRVEETTRGVRESEFSLEIEQFLWGRGRELAALEKKFTRRSGYVSRLDFWLPSGKQEITTTGGNERNGNNLLEADTGTCIIVSISRNE